MQKDQMQTLEEAKDVLKKAGVADDEMAALERQLAPPENDTKSKEQSRVVGFVSAGVVESNGQKVTANNEDIELPEESDSEEDERIEIALKEVPDAVFGSLIRKREESDEAEDDSTAKNKDNDGPLGALERIKRRKQEAS